MTETNEKNFVFILGSARLDGNTELLARHAAGFLPASVTQTWLRLIEHPLPAFEDIRHHESRTYEIATESESILLDATLAATDLVVASPVYWYSLSASTKLYLDHWSGWMRVPGIEFKARMVSKTLWAVSALSDNESADGAQPLVDTLRLTAEYMNMHWGGVLLGYGNRPGDVVNDPPSLQRAENFFGGLNLILRNYFAARLILRRFRLRELQLALITLFVLLATFTTTAAYIKENPLRGTLIVAVPVSNGLVVCADKRLYNAATGAYDDTTVKIRKTGPASLLVATNTVAFYDNRSRTIAFNAFDVAERYLEKNKFSPEKPFWDGLKNEITKSLHDYFAARKFSEWPDSDRANNNLLFNLIFYSLRDNRAYSHSLKVFYEKARTPVIYISDVASEEVNTPKLSGKGREVMTYLARNSAGSDPAIQRFDEARFDRQITSAQDAVGFARKLFQLTNSAVPQAQVSSAFDCALLDYTVPFSWIKNR